MATMYFAKVSMSSDIHNFYKDKSLYLSFLEKMFMELEEDAIVVEKTARGQEEYRLNSIRKNADVKTITGRLSKIYDGQVETYDRKKNKPSARSQRDLSSTINFYFDVESEIIAYVGSHWYIKALAIFKEMIENAMNEENLSVEVMILPNTEELTQKLLELKAVNEITITLIPPNPPNVLEFKELFGEKAEVVLDLEATHYMEKYENKSKKEDSKGVIIGDYLTKIIEGIKKGYGKLVAKGKNMADLNETISSDINTPMKHTIPTRERDNLIYLESEGAKAVRSVRQNMKLKNFKPNFPLLKKQIKIQDIESTIEETKSIEDRRKDGKKDCE